MRVHASSFGHWTVDNALSNVLGREGVLAVNSISCTLVVIHGIILLLLINNNIIIIFV